MTVSIIGELTADRRSIVLMASGPDHQVAEAAKRLQTLTPLVKPTDPPGGLVLPATWAAVVQLAASFGAWWRPGPALTTWIHEQLLARTADTGGDAGALRVRPPSAAPTPYPHQVAGARMIGLVGSAILGDQAGCGKTAATVLGIVERAAAGHPVLPIVVVCPNAVVDVWLEHIRDWAPYWRAVAWRGSPKRRRRLINTADVYVATYGLARSDAGTADVRAIAAGKSPLLELNPRFLVIDESHKIADPAAGQSRAVRKIAARVAANDGSSVALSGTLIKQTPKDLWSALYAISPEAFPSSERWVARYCDTIPGEYADQVIGLNQRAEPEFRKTILGQFRHISKADVLAHLPPKVHSVRTVEIPETWRKVYDALESQMLADLPDGGELEAMGVLAQLTRLLQIASAAADVEVTEETYLDALTGAPMVKKHQHVTLKAPSWKVDAALEVMGERPGQAFIAAAPSKQLVVLMGEAATKAGYRVAYLVGGQSAGTRTEQIAGFQRGDYDLICVTTGAGGVGVTLTAASCLIFLQRPWSFVEASQMEDRAHRPGSERHDSIEIVDIVTAKSVDTRVRQLLKGKAQQLSDFVMDPRIVAELLGGAGVRDLRRKDTAA